MHKLRLKTQGTQGADVKGDSRRGRTEMSPLECLGKLGSPKLQRPSDIYKIYSVDREKRRKARRQLDEGEMLAIARGLKPMAGGTRRSLSKEQE